MLTPSTTDKYILSRFDGEQKTFHLKRQDEDVEKLTITCNIKLEGLSNGTQKSVNVNMPLSDYTSCRLINPYLNAQSDVFKVKAKIGGTDKTIGYIFPFAALEGDEEDVEENFDGAKQAYKYYCLQFLIEQYNWNESHKDKQIEISSLINSESSYLIIYKPLLGDAEFSLSDLYPNLGLYGYYHFPENAKPNVNNLLSFGSNREELDEIIKGRYLYLRVQQSLLLKTSKVILEESPLIKLLYNQLLVEADNPLYRFLILYQVIEYLVDKSFKESLDTIILERGKYSNYKFIQQIHGIE